ncbi:hypothetical protein FN846DRAFT_891060 [Sphaerosporella brunnea]|uniref:Uncharacterized protein n=1 Tax=Sphaerosporella brunnea TaxID=1250544 RepID=A0A5J5EUR5_9PEZI|nr:hypothetical protein FN846DRAFT_891060 [Sphaerosporella brunnea]
MGESFVKPRTSIKSKLNWFAMCLLRRRKSSAAPAESARVVPNPPKQTQTSRTSRRGPSSAPRSVGDFPAARQRERDIDLELDASDHHLDIADIKEAVDNAVQYRQPASYLDFEDSDSTKPETFGTGETGAKATTEGPEYQEAEDGVKSRCDGCDTETDLSWCQACDTTFCNDCWSQQAAHKPRRTKPSASARVHEKTDVTLQRTLLGLTRRTSSTRMERRGSKSFWFGTRIEQSSNEVFLNFTDRLSSLGPWSQGRVPSVVSFVGETGAGKSSLIYALLKVKGAATGEVETPVVGNWRDMDKSVSSNVHLFPDPSAQHPKKMRIYADCEGLGGSTQISVKLQFPVAEQATRQWIVGNLYPAILCKQSDAVVYVTRNFRTIEVVISRMIQWAHQVPNSHSSRPSAIIVVNGLEDAKESIEGRSLWADDLAETILAKLADCIKQDPFLAQLSAAWRDQGRKIATLRDLALCYFRDIKLVCIPDFTASPSLLLSQWKKLDQEIQRATDDSKGVSRFGMKEIQELCHSLTHGGLIAGQGER